MAARIIPPLAGFRHHISSDRQKAKQSLLHQISSRHSDWPSSHHLWQARRALGITQSCLRQPPKVVGLANRQVGG